jgi:hypothetical protein
MTQDAQPLPSGLGNKKPYDSPEPIELGDVQSLTDYDVSVIVGG